MSETPTPTAVLLGKFRTELLDSGISNELADELVRDAAHQVFENEGFAVGVIDNA